MVPTPSACGGESECALEEPLCSGPRAPGSGAEPAQGEDGGTPNPPLARGGSDPNTSVGVLRA